MKTRFFTFLTIVFFTAMQNNADASGAMSFNGQNGRDPNARNITVKEWMDLIVRGITIPDLAYYTECPQDVLKENIESVTVPAQRILLEQLNSINATGELWVDANGKSAKITNIADAETIVNAYVSLEPLEEGKEYQFYSIDNSFNGKTGFVTRKIYQKGEMGFVLTTPKTKKKFLLGSAICANPAKIETMSQGGKGGLQGGGGFEQFDTTLTAGGTTIYFAPVINAYGGNVEHSGNSNVGASSAEPRGDAYLPGITEEKPTHHGESTSTTRTTTTTSTSDDVPWSGSGATATSESNSKTININMFNGNSLLNGGGGGNGYVQPRVGYQQQRGYCPPVIIGRNPTPPVVTGRGYDYVGVNATGGGNNGGRGYDFEAAD
jgi:hypothetical protein